MVVLNLIFNGGLNYLMLLFIDIVNLLYHCDKLLKLKLSFDWKRNFCPYSLIRYSYFQLDLRHKSLYCLRPRPLTHQYHCGHTANDCDTNDDVTTPWSLNLDHHPRPLICSLVSSVKPNSNPCVVLGHRLVCTKPMMYHHIVCS